MKLLKFYILLFIILSFFGCSSDDSKEEIIIELPPEEEIIPDPLVSKLIFPKDNTECIEGVIESDEYSKVTFQWEEAKNTDYYQLILRNLNTGKTISNETLANSLTISILRGIPFEWSIISKANKTTKSAVSEKWQFYNSGIGEAVHAPYPAKLIYPLNKSVKEIGEDYLDLIWEGNDLDNDILEYAVYFGPNSNPSTLVATLTETEFKFWSNSYELGKKYYWKIKTIDSHGNSSMSQIFSCVVN